MFVETLRPPALRRNTEPTSIRRFCAIVSFDIIFCSSDIVAGEMLVLEQQGMRFRSKLAPHPLRWRINSYSLCLRFLAARDAAEQELHSPNGLVQTDLARATRIGRDELCRSIRIRL